MFGPLAESRETSGTGWSLNTQVSLLAPPRCMETELAPARGATRDRPPGITA